MKRAIVALLIPVLFGGCASMGLFEGGGGSSRADLWRTANDALAAADFERAEAVFTQLTERYPDTLEGRESLFYLGAIRLDPRNPEWDPEPAETRLTEYLASSGEGNRERLYRHLEANTLRELARQLNLPPDSRVPGLQPEVRTVEERVVVPAQQSRELATEVERLRAEVAEKDARIEQQQQELERIRRTLAPSGQ